jgi:hypothetical protein
MYNSSENETESDRDRTLENEPPELKTRPSEIDKYSENDKPTEVLKGSDLSKLSEIEFNSESDNVFDMLITSLTVSNSLTE